jgi:hypothetical protein
LKFNIISSDHILAFFLLSCIGYASPGYPLNAPGGELMEKGLKYFQLCSYLDIGFVGRIISRRIK